jgi:nucleoside-diphosphate-sugar epimerase
MPRYLITGAAGFIGSQTARLALEAGAEVIGFDCIDPASRALSQHRMDRLQAYPDFRYIQADLRDAHALREALATEPDAVIHLGARAGVRASTVDPASFFDTNVTATAQLLRLMADAGVGRCVFASSSSVYADSPPPFREEDAASVPASFYAGSKRSAELALASAHRLFGIQGAAMRFFTVYGPAGRPDMSIFRFVERLYRGEPVVIFGDGNQSRDFTFVDDIARGILAATTVRGFPAINLACGQTPTTILDVLRKLEALTGRKAQIDHRDADRADARLTSGSIERAKELLGWEPAVSLDEGLAQVVDWHRAHRDWLEQVPLD